MQGGFFFFLGGIFLGCDFFFFGVMSCESRPQHLIRKVPSNCLCWHEIRKREVMIYGATRLLSFTCM